jgi:hypothetical protein
MELAGLQRQPNTGDKRASYLTACWRSWLFSAPIAEN